MAKKENTIPTIIDTPEALTAKIAAMKEAQKIFATFTQEQVDKIFKAAATAADKARIPLAKDAVEETGMGIVEDKVIKNHYAAEYVYNAYKNTRTCGVIEEDTAYGIKKIAEPIGLIAAVIPTTNPTSTAIFKTLIALKTRNAIIISPHPRAKKCTIEAAKVVLEAAVEAGAPEGIIGFIRDLNKKKEALHEPVYFKGEADGIEVEAAFQYVNEFHENVLGFCNNIYNAEGGTHLTGFKTTFTTVMNQYAREIGILKEKDTNFTGADIRNGMTAIISIKHPDPRFEGQTKTKLDNPDAAKAVGKVAGDEIVLYFDRNLDVLKTVLSSAEKAAKIRKTEEKAKTNLLTKQKYSFDSNGKLANCESRDPKKCEIFIVEGDSAGGSAKTARNRNFQAILPIRGKILNVEKASIDKVLANAEIKTMINAFGCGFSEGYGNDFDITKLRYDKIIIMADADVDGAHISTLLLTLFYRFMPELIYEGHVYIAMPPLYKAMPKSGEEEYLYDDKALEKYRRTHKGPFTLQRYKGLGEMDAEQLWETTLDPKRRLLKLVEIEDARMASGVTEMLMGTEVPPRRAFIYENATEAELDI